MTETTTAAIKAKTTKHAASSFTLPHYGMPKMPKFDLPNTEMPEAFREMAEKGRRACQGHQREGEGGVRASSRFARKHLCDRCQGCRQTTITNLSRLPVPTRGPPLTTPMSCWLRSPRRSLPSCRPRKCASNSRSLSAQNKELYALAQQVATEAAEPIKTGVSKALRNIGPTTNSFRNNGQRTKSARLWTKP